MSLILDTATNPQLQLQPLDDQPQQPDHHPHHHQRIFMTHQTNLLELETTPNSDMESESSESRVSA